MKSLYLLLLTLLITGLISGYEQFIATFPEGEYNGNNNYLTRSLIGKTNFDLEEKYPLVSESLSFIYLCDKDSSKFFYEYDLYHMEVGYLIEHIRQNYDHYAIASFKRNSYNLVVYSKHNGSLEERHYYLRSFDKEGKKIDEIEIGNLIPEGNNTSYSYKFSTIRHQTVKTFSYRDSVSFENRKELKAPNAKVLIDTYKIDSLGRFNLMMSDSIFLKGKVIDYDNFDSQPNADDPIAPYWTQW